MSLDTESIEALRHVKLNPLSLDTLKEDRIQRSSLVRPKGPVEPVHHVENRAVPGPACDIPVRIYRPQPSGGQPLSALVYLHGGGFCLWGLDEYDGICRALANAVPCVVVSVDYRLAPEHPFPAAVDDCYAALEWVAANAAAVGAESGLVAVGGDSAGGNLAAVVAVLARDRQGPTLALQILYYPSVGSLGPDYPSWTEHNLEAGCPGVLHNDDFKFFGACYLTDPAQLMDTRFNVMRDAMHGRGLPAALIVTAEVDPLRDQAKAYADKLQAAGVPVTYKQFSGTFHAFMLFELPHTKEALQLTQQALRKAFSLAA